MQHRLRYPVMVICGAVGLAIGYAVSIAAGEDVTGVLLVIDGSLK